jgi:hypothetical protein
VVRVSIGFERATGKSELQAVLRRLLLVAVLGSKEVCGGVVFRSASTRRQFVLQSASNLVELGDQASLGNDFVMCSMGTQSNLLCCNSQQIEILDRREVFL